MQNRALHRRRRSLPTVALLAQLLVDPGFPLGADRLVQQPLDGADPDWFGVSATAANQGVVGSNPAQRASNIKELWLDS